ncbi:TPA: glutamyl-tRNA reductase [Candidatus Latescibacteria bacterium]|nr:glutamyl-tRNA reductase [Candidatus Latescibacterota bacterium]
MAVVVVGVSHHTAPVDIRDRIAVPTDDYPVALADLARVDHVDEVALISTCNRTEAYAVADDPDAAVKSIGNHLVQRTVDADVLDAHLFKHQGEDAVSHLYRVAAGLDSMIMGEPQIAGQVKDAGARAMELGTSGRILNRLFRGAVEASKRARTETEIAAGAVSVPFAAVELAKKIFGNLEGQRAFVLGAGEMSELTARHLVENGVSSLSVASRTQSRAKELADAVNGRAMGWSDALERLQEADIVISSTSAPYYVIEKYVVAEAMAKRRNKQMFLIDIAVPRDISPEVESVYNVVLYDIDDLQAVVGANIQKRQEEAEKAWTIVVEEVAAFESWQQSLDVQPAVVALRKRFHEMMQQELERAKLNDFSEEQCERVEMVLRQFTNKLLHAPTTQLKKLAEDGEGADHVDTLIQLFNLAEELMSLPEQSSKSLAQTESP